MITVPSVFEKPFRVDAVNLDTGNVRKQYLVTADEVLAMISQNDDNMEFLSGWNRMDQSLIGTSHKDLN